MVPMKQGAKMKKYDLIVAGGGLSGVAAALAASRQGLQVLLVERSNSLGGAAVNCLINPFMPYWTMVPDQNGAMRKMYLSQGLFREISDELSAMSALGPNEMIFDEEYLKLILNRMVTKAGIELLFHSQVFAANVVNRSVHSITVANKSGQMELMADYFVDATGDADLAVLSGSPCHLGRDSDHLCQPMTLCFRVANVNLEAYQKSRSQINALYKDWQQQGKIKNIREDVLIFNNLVDGVLHFNSTRIVKKDPLNAWDVTAAEIVAREQVFELFHFMKDNIDGFQKSQLMMTASAIGVRESQMVDGVYTLTGEDLIACTKFDDVIVAGRCISSTHEAQASYRIMPICCCLGEAAGTATSVAAKAGQSVKDIDVRHVQAILKLNGAIL